MKKAYVKPMLNASMNGTLEGVYACNDALQPSNKNNNNNNPAPDCGGYDDYAGYGGYVYISLRLW